MAKYAEHQGQNLYKEKSKIGEENGANRNQPTGLQEDNKCCEHKLDVFDQLGNFLVWKETFWL